MAVVSRPKITVSADTVNAVKVLEVTTSVTSGAEGFYSTDQVTWIKIEDVLQFTENGVYYFKAVNPANGLESSSYTTLEVNNIDNEAPTLEITRDIEGLTNQDITLTANVSDGTVEYLDGSNWVVGSTLTVSQNGTYYFRVTDAAGNFTEKSVVINDIDKDPPTLEVTGNAADWTTERVTLTATASDGTIEYYDGYSWVTGDTLTVSENGTYIFRVTDAAGNVTEKSVVVDKIDTVADLNISHVLDGDNVTIFATSGEGTVEYYNGTEWVACNELTVSAAGTYRFRASDALGNVTEKNVVVVPSQASNLNLQLKPGDELIACPDSNVYVRAGYIYPDSSATIYEGALIKSLRAYIGAKINGFQLVRGVNTTGEYATISYMISDPAWRYLLRLSNSVVNSGDTGTLYAGQRANIVQVLSGGSVVVNDNAVIASVTVADGGSLTLKSGAAVERVSGNSFVISAGASLTIEAGVIFRSSISINAGAKVNGFIVTEATSLRNDFSLGSVSVAAGDTGTLYAGQRVENVQVAEGGSLVIGNGARVNRTVSFAGAGYLVIESGGMLQQFESESSVTATIYDGARFYSLNFAAGSQVNGFTLNYSATLYDNILAISDVTVNTGDTGTVYSGQTVSNIQVTSGGSLVILNGGKVETAAFGQDISLTIESGGCISGITNSSIRGDITICDGALFDNLYIASGSKLNGFTLRSSITLTDSQLAFGTTYSSSYIAVISAGDTGTVYAGQTVRNIRMQEGGGLVIRNGGVVEWGSFNQGVTLTIESGGRFIANPSSNPSIRGDITIYDGALFDKLNIYSGSKLNGFTLRSSITLTDNQLALVSTNNSYVATVNAGDTATLYAGQTASRIQVTEGGSLVLMAGASVDTVTVDSGASITVADGASFNKVTVASGASITIADGASFTSLHVYAGAIVNGIEIQRERSFSESGLNNFFYQTPISDGNSLTLGSGQTASDIQIAGGHLTIQDGAMAHRVNADQGTVTIHAGAQFGTITAAAHAEINGFTLESATTLSSSTVNIGQVTVRANNTGMIYAGQSASVITVAGGGRVVVYDQGTANGVYLLEGGAITVYAGAQFDSIAAANYAEINGFTLVISNGGIYASNYVGTSNTLNIALAIVNTGDTGTLYAGQSAGGISVLNGGKMEVTGDAQASMVNVYSGGSLNVYSGGSVNSSYVSSGGAVTLHDGAQFDSLQVYSGGRMNGFTASRGCTLTDNTVNIVDWNVYWGDTGVLYAGQSADGAYVHNGGTMEVMADAQASHINVYSGGSLNVYSGGSVNSSYVSGGGAVTLHDGAQFDDLTVRANGQVNGFTVRGGASFTDSTLNLTMGYVSAGDTATVYAGQLVQSAVVSSGGHIVVRDGGTAEFVSMSSGGTLLLQGTLDFTVNGGITFQTGNNREQVEVDGGKIKLSLANSFQLHGYKIAGITNETISVAVDNASMGNYIILSEYEGGFDTVTITKAGNVLGQITVGGNSVTDDTIGYSLVGDGSYLTIVVKDGVPPAAPVITSVSSTTLTNQDVIITLSVADDAVRNEYSLDGSVWNSFDDTVTAVVNGTYYFRSIDSDGNVSELTTYTVTNIDKVAPTLEISGNPTNWTNEDVTLTATASEGTVEYYNGSEWVAGNTLVVTQNGTYQFRVTDAAGNVNTQQVLVDMIDKIAPDSPTASADITGMTNQDVTVSATFSNDSTKQEYSFDGQNWFDYTEGIKVSQNCTIYFRGTDEAGNQSAISSWEVNNIDRLPTDKPVVFADITTPTNGKVCVGANFSDDTAVKEYSLNGVDWLTYTEPVAFEDNGVIYFRSTDAAGNKSDLAVYNVTNIDKVAPSLEISGNPTSWTNEDVTLTATASDGTVEYYNGSDWVAGESLAVDKNGTYQFRVTDAAGNVTEQSVVVNRIDKDAPTVPQLTVTCEGQSVTVSHSGVVEEGAGLNYTTIEISTDPDFNTIYGSYTCNAAEESKKITLADGNYYFRVSAIDHAGNTSAFSNVVNVVIDTVAPDKPEAFADVTAPTNDKVCVGANFSSDTAVKEYSLDGTKWFEYTEPVAFEDNGVIYFRGTDAAGNVSELAACEVVNIDKVPPTLEVTGNVTDWTDQDITLTATASDGTVEYFNGSEWVAGNTLVVSQNGTYLFRVTDAAGNVTEQSVVVNKLDKSKVPQNLVGSADGLSWDGTRYAESYQVELGPKDSEGVISIETADTQVDIYTSAENTFDWQVAADNGEWVPGNEIVIDGTDPQKLSSVENGYLDLFIAGVNGIWDNECVAQHVGMPGGWQGTDEFAVLDGKNILADIFEGSADANILLMTDDDNGDALFVDDIYTALPGTVAEQQARIARIDEIRAGIGDDIVDMTSQVFPYVGDGVKIYGGLGNDTIWSNNGDNTLFGDAGNDRLVGGSDNDVIIGGAGNDSMHGGGGSDTFCFSENWGADSVEQLAGSEIVLWFKVGAESNWDAEALTYTDGENSVTVSGVSSDKITLKFGDDGSLSYNELAAAGCFDDAVTEKIFEDKENGILA